MDGDHLFTVNKWRDDIVEKVSYIGLSAEEEGLGNRQKGAYSPVDKARKA